MTRPVFRSRHALDDLKSAVSCIARDNPEAAKKVAAANRSAGTKLGIRSTGRKGRVAGTFERSIRGLPYIIAYAIEPRLEGERIVIIHVIRTSRNWPQGRWRGP